MVAVRGRVLKRLAASVHVRAAVIHPLVNCEPSGGSRDEVGPHTNFGHGNLGGLYGCTQALVTAM